MIRYSSPVLRGVVKHHLPYDFSIFACLLADKASLYSRTNKWPLLRWYEFQQSRVWQFEEQSESALRWETLLLQGDSQYYAPANPDRLAHFWISNSIIVTDLITAFLFLSNGGWHSGFWLSIVQAWFEGQESTPCLDTEISRGHCCHWPQGFIPKCDGWLAGISICWIICFLFWWVYAYIYMVLLFTWPL